MPTMLTTWNGDDVDDDEIIYFDTALCYDWSKPCLI